MVYSTRRFVICVTVYHFVLVIYSPFSIAITLLGEERANLSAFHTFVRFVLVWMCRFPIPLGVWEGLRFLIVDSLDFSLTLFFKKKLTEQFNEIIKLEPKQQKTKPEGMSFYPMCRMC